MDQIHTAVEGLSCNYTVSVLTVDMNTAKGIAVQGTEPKQVIFVCMVNYHLASGSPADCVLAGASLFF